MLRLRQLILPVLALALLLPLSGCAAQQEDSPASSAELFLMAAYGDALRATVLDIVSDETEELHYEGFDQTMRTVTFTARITGGSFDGLTVTGRQTHDSLNAYKQKVVTAGDLAILQPIEEMDGTVVVYFAEFYRVDGLIALAVVFVALLLLLGRGKGLRALISLALTVGAVFFLFVPLVLGGGSPVWGSVAVCALVSVATLIIVCGFSIKMVSAVVGCLVGILTAGALAAFMQTALSMSGFADEEAMMLSVNVQSILGMNIDMAGVMFAAIIIGAVGATMDMSVSIASALEELAEQMGDFRPRQLLTSGLKIGRDVMGTMSNTLILAYVGGSLHVILLIAVNAMRLDYVFSLEMVATEVVRSLAGSIGLIAVVPATALASSLLYRRKAGQTGAGPDVLPGEALPVNRAPQTGEPDGDADTSEPSPAESPHETQQRDA